MTPEDLTPTQREEAQEQISKIYLMRHTPIPREDGGRWGFADRRQCVRDAIKPEPETPAPWPHTWFRNDQEASYRRNGGIPGI